jgi:hypothetical protein
MDDWTGSGAVFRREAMMRGRPAIQAQRIRSMAWDMHSAGERVNKSRIARELHAPIRTVFRVLKKNARHEFCHMPEAISLV